MINTLQYNFYDHLNRFGEHPAVVLPDGEVVNYAALDSLVQKAKARLSAGPGLVFLLCKNELPVLISYLACLQACLPVLLLDGSTHEKQLKHLRQIYQPSMIISTDGQIDKLPVAKDQIKEISSELALLLSTSGSTGSPKQVMLSYRNLQSNADAIAEYLGLNQSERAITTLPFNYSYGLSVINSHLSVGATIILNSDSVLSKHFWHRFDHSQPSSMAGVPHTYEMLKKLRFHRRSLGNLRYMTQAGGKLSEELVTWFANTLKEKNIRFFVMYGQTEATARMAYLDADEVLSYAGSIGKAIPGGRFELLDQDGHRISQPGEKGELHYYGDNVMLGYASSLDDLSAHQPLRFLATGDMAYFDAEGRFTICGRKDRTIKVFGHRLDLDDLQEQLRRHGWHVVCAGEADKVVIGLVDPEEDSDSTRRMISHLTEWLPFNIKVVSILRLAEIPKTSSGKIAYAELLQLAA